MNFWKALNNLAIFILILPFALLSFSILAAGSMWFYDSTFFVAQRPTRALEHIFSNPEQAQILKSRQNGAFMIGKHARYMANLLLQGENLKFLPEIQVSKSPYLPTFLDGIHDYCLGLLKLPKKDLQFYDGTYSNIEVYGVQHQPSHRYCFDYDQL